MDDQQRAEVKARLQQEKEKTQQAIAEYKDMSQPIAPENAIGRVSRMDAINNKSVVEAALRKAEEKLRKLNEMEKKLDEKDFGICRKCGQPIPIGRLLLVPQSSKCVNCAR